MWENKVHVGRGNLDTFKEHYEKLNAQPFHKCNASQIFLLFYDPDYEMAKFDFVIYYSVETKFEEAINSKPNQKGNINTKAIATQKPKEEELSLVMD